MKRLTVPDERIDEHTMRRTFIDAEAVREHAMEFYWRLKAYEDTWLTPEEIECIKQCANEDKELTKCPVCLDERIRELAEADQEGRVVVLPCKVGDTVWYNTYINNGRTCLGIRPHKVIAHKVCMIAESYPINTELQLDWLGKVWYLSQEEAKNSEEVKKKFDEEWGERMVDLNNG